jgi:hypothetical protein
MSGHQSRPPGAAAITPAMLDQVRELALAHELQKMAYRARFVSMVRRHGK